MSILLCGIVAACVACVAAFEVNTLTNIPKSRKRRHRGRQRAHGASDKRITTTKVALLAVMLTYIIAFAVAVYMVLCRDAPLSDLLTYTGAVAGVAVAFYCWKAKAENLEKIKKSFPDLSGSLSDFTNMT